MSLSGELIDIALTAKREGWLDRLLDVFRTKHRVLITGPTGAGKSQLRRSFMQMHADAIGLADRTSFPVVERLTIGKQLFDVVDLPGQSLHRAQRFETFREALARGVAGVVSVVSDGYHEYERGRFDALDEHGVPRPDFLDRHRQAEVDALDEWTVLRTQGATPWIITVVTKADLWWHDWDRVRAQYEDGAYARRLSAASAVPHTVIPYASVVHKFYGQAPVSGHFTDVERSRFRSRLLRTMLEAIGKGHLPVGNEG